MKSTVWKTLFMYGLGLGLLAWVVIDNWNPRGGRPGLPEVLRRPIHVGPLFLAALVTVVGLMITFLRWHLLVRAVGLPFKRYDAVRLGLVGYYFNTFLPGSLGGDIFKAYSIAREQNRRTVAVATVVIDRVIGLWALVWFVGIVGGVFWILGDPILKNDNLMMIVRYSIIVVVASMGVWTSLGFLPNRCALYTAERFERIPKIGGSLAELWRACWMYKQQSRAVLFAMLLTLVSHFLWVVVFHLSIQAFETPNPAEDIGTFPEHLIVVPVGMTIQALIPVPGGIGAGEAAFGELYKIIGKPEVNGIVGCMSQRIVFWTIGFLGYFVYTRMRRGIPINEKTANSVDRDKVDPDPGIQTFPNALASP